MQAREYTEVDVFSPTPYRGNPLAVVHDGTGLSTAEMQRFARWTNLAETTFLFPPESPEADYRVRIFTATRELPFAGHPTLGSAFAWLRSGGKPQQDGIVMQECGAGLVPVRVGSEGLSFAAPQLTKFEPLDEPLTKRIAGALGISPSDILEASWLVNGPEWIGVRLASAADVIGLQPDPAHLERFSIGVVGPYEPGHEAQFEVRAFVGGDPVWEDPVTGSLNAGIAHWLITSGLAGSEYVASQGTAIGFEGRVNIVADSGDIWVGGNVSLCVTGEVSL